MTPVGNTILITYSILAVIILMAVSVRKLEKRGGKGWEAAILLPVFIFLINQI